MLDIKSGCYDVCNYCSNGGRCCSSFDRINAPVLNNEEMIKIREILNSNNFYEIVDKKIYIMKLNNNKCIFWRNGRCSIYKNRPLDCRLYPFDIIKKDSKYYLVLYQLDCISDYKIVEDFNCIDNLIDEIKPWIEAYIDDRNYTKMKKLKYRIIKLISEE